MKKNVHFSPVSLRSFLGFGLVAVMTLVMSAPALASAEIINRELEITMRGTDVSAMQTFLANDPTLYPQGLVTGYFGFLTKSAVSNFQSRNGISAVGRVGPVTLPVLNYQMANGTQTGADVYAPLITSVQINTFNTSATIAWTTREASQGKLYYSTSPIQIRNTFDATGVNFVEPSISGVLASYDAGVRSSQSVNINGLMSNTTYYYVVEVFDASNNTSITLPASFHTSS